MSIVVTGVGAITALGASIDATWHGLIAGDTGIARISRFDAEGYPAHVGAEVHDTGVSGERARTWRTGTQCFFTAASAALDQAGLDDAARCRAACIAGLSVNYVHHGFLRDVWLRQRDEPSAHLVDAIEDEIRADARHAFRRDGGWQVADVSRALGLGGPRALVDTACASSLHALIEAVRWLRSGLVETVVVGGGCALVNPLSVVAFGRIGALSAARDPRQAARPFDRRRDGFVLGEGGAAIVLEREATAVGRGRRPLARISGVGASTNAASLTDPSPGGLGEAAAICAAIEDAGCPRDSIDLVVAHGTATPRNDVAETGALLSVLGAHAHVVPVVSIKGAVGHTLAAAGMLNVVVAVESIRRGRIPPTCGWGEPDPECMRDHVKEPRAHRIRAALVNAFAFGGQNAAAVVEACA